MVADVEPTPEEVAAAKSQEVGTEAEAPEGESAAQGADETPWERNFSRQALGIALPQAVARIPDLSPEYRHEALDVALALNRHIPSSAQSAVASKMLEVYGSVTVSDPRLQAPPTLIILVIEQAPLPERQRLFDTFIAKYPAAVSANEQLVLRARWNEQKAEAELHQEIQDAADAPQGAQRFEALQHCATRLSSLAFSQTSPDSLVEALLNGAMTLSGEEHLAVHGTLAKATVPHEHVPNFLRQMASHVALLAPEHRFAGVANVFRAAAGAANFELMRQLLDATLAHLETGLMDSCSVEEQSKAYNLCARLALKLPPGLGMPLLERYTGRRNLQTSPTAHWTAEQVNAVALNLQQWPSRPLGDLSRTQRSSTFRSWLEQAQTSSSADLMQRLARPVRALPDLDPLVQSEAYEALRPLTNRLQDQEWSQLAPELIRNTLPLYGLHLSPAAAESKMVAEAHLQAAGLLLPNDIQNADDATLMSQAKLYLDAAMDGEMGNAALRAAFKSIPPQRMTPIVSAVVKQLRDSVQQDGSPEQGLRAWRETLGEAFISIVASLHIRRRLNSLLSDAAARGAGVYSAVIQPFAQAFAEMKYVTYGPDEMMWRLMALGHAFGEDVGQAVYRELMSALPAMQQQRGPWETAVNALVDWAILQPGDASEEKKSADRTLGMRVLSEQIATLPPQIRQPTANAVVIRLGQLLDQHIDEGRAVPPILAVGVLNGIAPQPGGPSLSADHQRLFVRAVHSLSEAQRSAYMENLPPEHRALAQRLLDEART